MAYHAYPHSLPLHLLGGILHAHHAVGSIASDDEHPLCLGRPCSPPNPSLLPIVYFFSLALSTASIACF